MAKDHEDDIWSLPFPEFIERVVRDYCNFDFDFEIDGFSKLWELTRYAKGYFKEGTVDIDTTFDRVSVEINKLGGWPKFGLTEEDAYNEFRLNWKNIRYLPDETPLSQAWARARAYPVKSPPRKGSRRATPGYDRFISLAGYLQITVGDRPILLPVKEVAELMGTDKHSISVWRRLAVEDGFLNEVTPAKFNPHGKGKATEFRVAPGYLVWFKQHYRDAQK